MLLSNFEIWSNDERRGKPLRNRRTCPHTASAANAQRSSTGRTDANDQITLCALDDGSGTIVLRGYGSFTNYNVPANQWTEIRGRVVTGVRNLGQSGAM